MDEKKVDRYKLPKGVNIPERYRDTHWGRNGFVFGVRDGMAGKPVPAEHLARMHPVWQDAYRLGHSVGHKLRL
jgi:hypothetical protein